MYKTEKKYWKCGFDRRGNFWSYAFKIGSLGVMICKPSKDVPLINLYKLT